jgi:hypothetical protein
MCPVTDIWQWPSRELPCSSFFILTTVLYSMLLGRIYSAMVYRMLTPRCTPTCRWLADLADVTLLLRASWNSHKSWRAHRTTWRSTDYPLWRSTKQQCSLQLWSLLSCEARIRLVLLSPEWPHEINILYIHNITSHATVIDVAFPWLTRLVGGPGSIPGQYMWNFLCIQWHCGRFSPVNLIPPVLHYLEKRKKLIIFLFIFITGLHNKP